jgi:hypothetical protein
MDLSNRVPDSRSLIRIVVIAAAVAMLLGCKPEAETTGSTDAAPNANACAAKLYSSYDPKNFEQCVDVCLRCQRGVTTTCTTSCTLKGAR